MATYHLAQLNIARLIAPIDSPTLAGFVARLDEINALADGAPGFVWRLQTDEGNATALRVYEDDRLLVNLSVWESIEALHAYTYKTAHADLIRDRQEWFSRLERPHLVLWWIPAGHIPDTTEARDRLDHLTTHGPTPLAFTFARRYSIEEMLAAQPPT